MDMATSENQFYEAEKRHLILSTSFQHKMADTPGTAVYSLLFLYISITLSLFFFGQYRPISALFKRCISISKKGKEISPNVESILMCRRFSCVMILITFGLVFYPFHQTNKHGVGFTVVPLCRSLSAVEMPIGSSRIRRHIVRGNVA